MTTTQLPAVARHAVISRLRREMADLDYKRDLRQLLQGGHSQREVARWLRISQPSVTSAAKTAAKVPPAKEGFSGASPFEICQRYAAGLLSREHLMEELARWDYPPADTTDGYDWITVDPPGAWSEVTRALDQGLVDEDLYDEILARKRALRATS